MKKLKDQYWALKKTEEIGSCVVDKVSGFRSYLETNGLAHLQRESAYQYYKSAAMVGRFPTVVGWGKRLTSRLIRFAT